MKEHTLHGTHHEDDWFEPSKGQEITWPIYLGKKGGLIPSPRYLNPTNLKNSIFVNNSNKY